MSKTFLHSLPIFAIFDDFAKWSTPKGAAELKKIIEYGKK